MGIEGNGNLQLWEIPTQHVSVVSRDEKFVQSVDYLE